MATNIQNIPSNRDEFCARYKCSKTTFRKWITVYELEKVVPNIKKIKVFTRNQSEKIIAILG
ncbi:hypothetical protein [Emticicia sp. 17c]|uniref:hypothetical protein n=1 Tax=Emticicia sp. 17c TaxID=3127704 RepID=UPI00301E47FE